MSKCVHDANESVVSVRSSVALPTLRLIYTTGSQLRIPQWTSAVRKIRKIPIGAGPHWPTMGPHADPHFKAH